MNCPFQEKNTPKRTLTNHSAKNKRDHDFQKKKHFITLYIYSI
jgi:hypothetical protein